MPPSGARGGGRQTAVLAVVARYLHVREVPPGSNRSPEIDRWLRAVGSPLGSPWCAAFVLGCLKESGDTRKVVRSGRVQVMVDGGAVLPATQAVPGDMVVFWFTKLGRYAHIAFVERVEGNVLVTVEGNTIADGATGDSREGWGVFGKRRTISDRIKVLR